jgi:hypothetical protein
MEPSPEDPFFRTLPGEAAPEQVCAHLAPVLEKLQNTLGHRVALVGFENPRSPTTTIRLAGPFAGKEFGILNRMLPPEGPLRLFPGGVVCRICFCSIDGTPGGRRPVPPGFWGRLFHG